MPITRITENMGNQRDDEHIDGLIRDEVQKMQKTEPNRPRVQNPDVDHMWVLRTIIDFVNLCFLPTAPIIAQPCVVVCEPLWKVLNFVT